MLIGMLGNKLNRQHFETFFLFFFFFFFFFQKIGFDISCKLSQFHEMLEPIFWGKNKKNMTSFSELAHRVGKYSGLLGETICRFSL